MDTADRNTSRYHNIKIATYLNIGFTLVELIGGALTNSLAILADALHDLGDSMVLISSWRIERMAERRPDWKRTFGYRRLSLLAAFLNAVVLLGGSLIIVFQVIGRLVNPQPVHATGVIGIAVIGIIANTMGSLRLRHGGSLNEKILSWHLLEDVLGWIGILIAGVVMHFTGFYRLDPLITIGFTAFVMWGVWRNSRELLNVFVEGVPSEESVAVIVREIEAIAEVQRVCDIHVWSLDGNDRVCSLKAVLRQEHEKDHNNIRQAIKQLLLRHRITHSTVELVGENFYAGGDEEQDFLTQK